MRFSSIRVEDVPIGGATNTCTLIREADGPEVFCGWRMHSELEGIVCEKGARTLLVPWGRVLCAEVQADPAPEHPGVSSAIDLQLQMAQQQIDVAGIAKARNRQ